ncbi:TPA: hypothetical protein ACGAE8_000534 [Escherichia coli]|uniref:DNA-binding protein n=1 Tax=Escherichia coli TaxID=562 RepID=A0AAN1ILC7_ECOLX|nr:hypothetical protein [Escherichia coli]AUK01367.1 hypothetical protein CR538_13660 [Escherichia coli]EEC8207694.1 hypothetical protein [Escherichia coli]EEC8858472.1 hypothetical protein [Escherichia coli]EEQ6383693.1 hypothetical protein [Escherichia coli]EET1884710.1 hypothetical protein [Escherichia coli]
MNTVTAMNTAVKTASVSLVVDNEVAKMTLREIADLIGVRFSNLETSMNRLVERQVIRKPATQNFEKINNLGFAVTVKDYVFEGEQGRLDSIVLIAQNVPEFTRQLVDRWNYLEEKLKTANNTPVNPYADFEETDWIELALKKTRENKQLITLHHRKSVDSHSMTRLLGAKKGATKVKEALTALRTAGYIERVYDENNKPCGYVANDSAIPFCSMNAHYQLSFTVDVLPVLVELGVLEEEQKAALTLPKPNNTIMIQNKATIMIRQNVGSLEHFGL